MNENNNVIEPRLQYIYALLDDNDCCIGCRTCSYEVPLDTYIPVPVLSNEYIGKWYDRETGLWYYDQEHTQIFDINAV